MPQSAHLHIHLNKKERKSLLDKVVEIASFLYPLSGIPQLYLVMQGEVTGVSLVSWTAFALFSAIFLLYGIVHKVRPMIVINMCWLIIDLLIILGVLVHRMAS